MKSKKTEKMEKAIKRAINVCSHPGMADPFKDGWKWFYELQRSLEK